MENEAEKQIEREIAQISPPEVQIQVVSLFGTKDVFEHAQRVGLMLSKSDLVPKQYQNNPGNCIIALEMANRIGASPLMIMQNLYIVHGKPAWSSSFLIATVNACGKFSALRYEEDPKDGGSVRAWAYDKKSQEKLLGVWVSMKMAQAEGWIEKSGSKWKTMPELMIRYRAATFFARQYAPEISMGIHSVDEIEDAPYIELKDTVSFEDLNALFLSKEELLSAADKFSAKRILDQREERSYSKLHAKLKSI